MTMGLVNFSLEFLPAPERADLAGDCAGEVELQEP